MVRALVLSVVFACLAIEGHASSYLFGLTEAEIDDVMTHYYPKGYDRAVVLRQMAEPFDCRNFGDLCREVGEDYAYRIVENTWVKARRQQPVEMIDRAVRQQYEDLARQWFERMFPDGVPALDPFWGDEKGESSCDDTVTAQSGDRRVVHTSRRHALGLFGWGRVKVEHFEKNFWGNFKPERADRLHVEGTIVTQLGSDPPTIVLVSDTKEDAKQVSVTETEGGLHWVTIHYVSGDGGVVGNPALQAASCSGVFPPF
jgi:hypothetical protein